MAEDEAAAEEKQKAIDDAVKKQDLPKDVIHKSEDEVDDSVEGEYIDNKLSEDEFSDFVDINNDVIEGDEEIENEQDDISVSEKIAADMMDVCPPYATSFGCDEYTNGSSLSFIMDGKYYTSGLTFEDSSFALFYLDEQYSEMTFDIGSALSTGDYTVTFTVDDEVVKEMKVDGSKTKKTITIPLNYGRQLRIDVFGEILLSKCGLGNIMVK